MKRDITPHLKKAAEQVALTPSEREQMAYVLREYMALKPLRADAPSRARRFLILEHTLSIRTLVRRHVPALLVIALVFTTGGVAYAAEGAVPGEALYGVKVEVTERLRSALTFSVEGKATWEARRAERRIEEAARLAAEGKLDDGKRSAIVASFEAQALAAEEAIERLESSNTSAAIELASHMETALSAHNAILTELVREERRRQQGEDYDDSDETEGRIAVAVRNGVDRIAKIRVRAEGELAFAGPMGSEITATSSADLEANIATDDQKSAAQRMGSAASSRIDATATLIARGSSALLRDEQERINEELEDAREALGKGNEAFREGRYGVAYRLYQEAYVGADQLYLYIKASATLHVRLPAQKQAPALAIPVVTGSEIPVDEDSKRDIEARGRDDARDGSSERSGDGRDLQRGETEIDLGVPLLR